MKLMQRLRTRTKVPKSEQGMVMAIALLMGLMLTAASGGLLAKQLMLRRLGAAEGYKQIAEMASSTGFNRILAAMNDVSAGGDISYLWELSQNKNFNNQDSDQREWEASKELIPAKISQPCYPIVDASELSEELQLTEENIIEESNNIEASYRLRSYSYGDTSGTFEIEGYATQAGTQRVLSRDLLTRELSIEEAVSQPSHWGVMAAESMELGDSSIDGDGLTIWLINKDQAAANFSGVSDTGECKEVIAEATDSTNSSALSKLWARADDGNQFPNYSNLFGRHVVHQEELDIDTTRLVPVLRNDQVTEVNGMIQRAVKGGPVTEIRLTSDYLCNGQTEKPCLVMIKNLKLTNDAKLLVDTSKIPVILRLTDSSTSFDLASGSICQGQSLSGEPQCNADAKAERMVIVAPVGNQTGDCQSGESNLILAKGSLPSAVVLMPQGKTQVIEETALTGLLWSNKICAQKGLKLKTNNNDGSSVISGFRTLWGDDKFQFGRTIWRGVRGKAHDRFLRW